MHYTGYWTKLYQQIKAGKATWEIAGLQCTSAVMQSLGDFDSGGCDQKQFLLKMLGAKHTCGSNKGSLIKVQVLQHETDPYK